MERTLTRIFRRHMVTSSLKQLVILRGVVLKTHSRTYFIGDFIITVLPIFRYLSSDAKLKKLSLVIKSPLVITEPGLCMSSIIQFLLYR